MAFIYRDTHEFFGTQESVRRPSIRRWAASSAAEERGSVEVRIVVDLNRCQSYGQCVFAAPTVFRLRDESLEYDYAPDASLRLDVERAAAACPVQAISIGHSPEPLTRQNASAQAERDRAS